MRVAVCHDRLANKGGGERVAISLAKNLNADLIVAKYEPEKTFDCKGINVINLNSVGTPSKTFLYPFANMADAFRFSRINLKKYDIVITSGMWAAFAKGKKTVYYCHSPARFLYDLKEFYTKNLPFCLKAPADLWCLFWTHFDQRAVKKNPDLIIANSRTTQQRIKKYYNQDSVVIYPPVKEKKFRKTKPKNYFISVQRIMPEKRIELQIEVFKRLKNENLVIVGKAEKHLGYSKKIETLIKETNNIKWIKDASDKELEKIISQSKALIATAVNEDFGLAPVEAMMLGKPCIAVNEGGYKETITQKTGILVKKPYIKKFAEAINSMKKFSAKECWKRAMQFSEKRFIREIKKVIRNELA